MNVSIRFQSMKGRVSPAVAISADSRIGNRHASKASGRWTDGVQPCAGNGERDVIACEPKKEPTRFSSLFDFFLLTFRNEVEGRKLLCECVQGCRAIRRQRA